MCAHQQLEHHFITIGRLKTKYKQRATKLFKKNDFWILERAIMLWIRVLLPFKACQAQCFSAPVPFFSLGQGFEACRALCGRTGLQTPRPQSVAGREPQPADTAFLKCEENKTPL